MKRVLSALVFVALATPAIAEETLSPSATKSPPIPQAIEPRTEVAPFAVIGGDWRASQLIGASVRNTRDVSVGEIDDVILDNDGKVVSVLVSVGGFLGLGEKQVHVSFKDLTMSRTEDGDLVVQTSLSEQALETAPDSAGE